MPRESLSCAEAQYALAQITSLATEFDRAFEDALHTGKLEETRTLRATIEQRMREIREGLISPLERKLDLKRQYEAQRQVLESAGILEQLPNGERGIHSIDGNVHSLPSYQEIRSRLREKREILKVRGVKIYNDMGVVCEMGTLIVR